MIPRNGTNAKTAERGEVARNESPVLRQCRYINNAQHPVTVTLPSISTADTTCTVLSSR